MDYQAGGFELASEFDATTFAEVERRSEPRFEGVVEQAVLSFRGEDYSVPVVNISSRGTMVESDISAAPRREREDPLRRLQPDLRLRPLGPRRPRRPQVRLRDDPGLRPPQLPTRGAYWTDHLILSFRSFFERTLTILA